MTSARMKERRAGDAVFAPSIELALTLRFCRRVETDLSATLRSAFGRMIEAADFAIEDAGVSADLSVGRSKSDVAGDLVARAGTWAGARAAITNDRKAAMDGPVMVFLT